MREKVVGIIGLGLMGQAFSTRLQSQGYETLGYDINHDRCHEFGSARVASSAIALAEKTDALILCLFDAKQIQETLLGPQGLLLSPRASALNIICTSTCEPEAICEIAAATHKHSAHFIEMPISGTSKQVANGDCLGLIGGDKKAIDNLSPILDAMCAKRMYVGEIGSASKAKLAINLVLGLHRAALAEGLVFGQRIGLDTDTLLSLLQNSAAESSVMRVKGPFMTKRKYDEPQSRVDQSLKDFGLIHKLATQNNQPLPLATQYTELLEACLERGEGKQDNAIIFEAIHRRGDSN